VCVRVRACVRVGVGVRVGVRVRVRVAILTLSHTSSWRAVRLSNTG
jgi:hypothetical protein